jgi:hypothetical protein
MISRTAQRLSLPKTDKSPTSDVRATRGYGPLVCLPSEPRTAANLTVGRGLPSLKPRTAEAHLSRRQGVSLVLLTLNRRADGTNSPYHFRCCIIGLKATAQTPRAKLSPAAII